jgi:hypothetical protein
MPKQSPLKIIKRWRRYERRGDWKYLLPITRGVYVLYKEQKHRTHKIFNVVYIGVAGIAMEAKTGINGRLRQHDKTKKDWTHYSFFEVHDNVSREEILELENFLLAIFRHDPRIELENKQSSSKRLRNLRLKNAWLDVPASREG